MGRKGGPMTEAEWLACEDVPRMLASLRGKVSGRKLRLFACACCRRLWDWWEGRVGERLATETSERFADGLATGRELRAAGGQSEPIPMGGLGERGAGHNATRDDAWDAADVASRVAAETAGNVAYGRIQSRGGLTRLELEAEADAAEAAERQHQITLLRCIFPGPEATALRGSAPTPMVASLAVAAYDERILPSGHLDAARLGVLSDALEEAGCSDAGILTHLRSPGPHVRGCWALDLVLGRG